MSAICSTRFRQTIEVECNSPPLVLSLDEMKRLLEATTCLKHQAAFSVAYGAGLRVAEVSALKVSDIDSERMLLRIERGKPVLSACLGRHSKKEGDTATRCWALRDALQQLEKQRAFLIVAGERPSVSIF